MTSAAQNSAEIIDLYERLLTGWNRQEARVMGELFSEKGNIVGFDGSQLNGPAEIVDTLGFIFSQHATAKYVAIVREVRFITETVALLRASVGMVPRQGKEINPAVNAIQSLICEKSGANWKISLFQNTPTAWHGRTEDLKKLSYELNDVAQANKIVEDKSAEA